MRAPSPTVELTSRLQPIASPVNTYVRPAEPSTSNLWQVAESIGNFDRSLQGFLDQRRAKDAEDDKIRGEAAFWKDNAEGAAEGVRNGTIPPFASPSFMEGYKAAKGRSAGIQLAQRFQVDYLTWGGKGGEDPAAFDQFFAEWAKKNVTTDDPAVLRGLLPQLRAIHEGASSQFTRDLSENIYGGAVRAHLSETAADIDKADLDGRLRPEGTDYEAVWSALMTKREAALATGVRSEDFDKELFNTLATKALQHRDPGLLELLDRSLPGSSTKISDSPEGLAIKLDTEAKLEGLARRAEVDAEQQAAREAKLNTERFTREAIEALSQDPNQALPEEMLEEGSKWDPEYRTKVLDWQRKLQESGVREDPKAITELYSELLGGGGMDTVRRGLEAGVIRDEKTLREATSFVRSLKGDSEDGTGGKALRGRTFTAVMDAIRKRTQADEFTDYFDPGGISDEGLEAQVDYQRLLLDWASRNPNASEIELEEARARIGKLILEGINTEERTYEPTKGSVGSGGGGNPFTTSTPQASPDAATTGLGNEDLEDPASPAEASGGDLEPYKAAHPPEFRTRVEEEAKRRGISPDEIWKALREMEQGAEEPAPAPNPDDQSSLQEDGAVQLASFAPEIGDTIDDMFEGLTDRPQVALRSDTPGVTDLLAHIGDIEAPKGYNQMFGERTPRHNLTAMTVDEVLALQRSRVRGGSASSAAGRYQFLSKTLRSLKNDLGLDGSEQFTPELQDRLALALLERRGLSKYLAGEWTAKRFANSLAREWASLPVVSGGKAGQSYYAGDGLNKALTGVQDILALVEAIRGPSSPTST